MAVTDIVTLITNAWIAVMNADTGVQALTGRTERNVRPWGALFPPDPKEPINTALFPVYTFAQPFLTEEGGAGDNRTYSTTITAWADTQSASGTGRSPQELCDHMIERVEKGITEPLLSAQGVDAAPWRRTRRGVEGDREGSRGLARSDIDLDLFVTKVPVP